MFIGEAPGAQEDESGLPFVGRSGQLLTRVLESNGIRREDVFISNIVRCRPPGNRDPKPEEIKACAPWLERQIELIDPPLLCVLGRHAAATLLGRPIKIMQEHGQWMEYRGRKLLIALHPSAALRMPKFRASFEEDIRVLAEEYGKYAG
jgi:DNA polymerase